MIDDDITLIAPLLLATANINVLFEHSYNVDCRQNIGNGNKLIKYYLYA